MHSRRSPSKLATDFIHIAIQQIGDRRSIMPSLRNKSTSDQDHSISTDADQTGKDSTASIQTIKSSAEKSETIDRRPSSPRRLRDRRLLAAAKTESAPSNEQQISSIKTSLKPDCQPKPSPNGNYQRQAHAQSSYKRPSSPLDSEVPPRSMLKRSPNKIESLLLSESQSKSSASSSVPESNDLMSTSRIAFSKSANPRGNSLLVSTPKSLKQPHEPMGQVDVGSFKSSTPSSSRLQNQHHRVQQPPSHSKNDIRQFNESQGLNLIKNKQSHEVSQAKNVTFSNDTDRRRSSSSTAPQQRSESSQSNMMNTSRLSSESYRLSLSTNSPKQPNVKIAPPSHRSIDASLIQSGSKRLISQQLTQRTNNVSKASDDLTMTLNQLGAAINMTKNMSKVRAFNVLIAVTGSVAAIKLVELIKKLRAAFPRSFTDRDNRTYKATIAIKVVMTENSKHFIPKEEVLRNIGNAPGFAIFDDSDEWTSWGGVGDPVLHIELRKWADLCLIAPLDANTMAKIANGICDNLLTCTIRAWDTSKPLIYCPAMNVNMWDHPITNDHLGRLSLYGYERVDCIEKRLACGDFGFGAMAAVDTIVGRVVDSLTDCLKSRSPPKQQQNTSFSTPSTSKSQINETMLSKLFEKANALINSTPKAIPESDSHTIDVFVGESSSAKSNNQYQVPFSLQNLKAIDFGNPPEVIEDIDVTSNDVDGVDYESSDEMVQAVLSDGLDETSSRNSFNQKKIASLNGIPSGSGNGRPTRMLGPSADPSTYISQCYNKSRNCFTCIICKNDYKNRKSMSRHLKEQHLQGNIHRCIPCGVSYKRREKLIKHNRECHDCR